MQVQKIKEREIFDLSKQKIGQLFAPCQPRRFQLLSTKGGCLVQ
jgi:hypothetical protein